MADSTQRMADSAQQMTDGKQRMADSMQSLSLTDKMRCIADQTSIPLTAVTKIAHMYVNPIESQNAAIRGGCLVWLKWLHLFLSMQ